jgi:hypothetical protein
MVKLWKAHWYDYFRFLIDGNDSFRFNENVLVVNMMKWHLQRDNYVQQMVIFFFSIKNSFSTYIYCRIVEGQTVFFMCPKCLYVSYIYRLIYIYIEGFFPLI